MTACSFGAIATTFTYIAPLLQEVGGFSPRAVTGVLFVGNYLGGRAADRRPMATLIVLFAAFAVILLAFGFTVHVPTAAVVTAFLFGLAGYAFVPSASRVLVARSIVALRQNDKDSPAGVETNDRASSRRLESHLRHRAAPARALHRLGGRRHR